MKLRFRVQSSSVSSARRLVTLGEGQKVLADVPHQVVHLVAEGHSHTAGSLKLELPVTGELEQDAELVMFTEGTLVEADFSIVKRVLEGAGQ